MYYLSAEFLMGRSLTNAVQNLELTDTYSQAVKQLGYGTPAQSLLELLTLHWAGQA